MSIEEKVKACFRELAKLKGVEIDMNADLRVVYGVDSMRAKKLISDIEVEYNIEIPDEKAQQIRCLNDVVILIKELSSAN